MQQGPSATEGRPSLLEYAEFFADEIRAVGAEPALYMVWPSQARSFDFEGVSDSYLGLSISYRYAQTLGGELSASARDGGGAILKLEFPARVSDPTAVPPKESDPEPPRILRQRPASGRETGGAHLAKILVVDDKENNRSLLTALLEESGTQAREARDGHEAISDFEAWSPDVILMDVRMPGMDGLEATRRIRALPGGDTVVIIALSGGVLDEERDAAHESGVDAFLNKPFRIARLFDAIRESSGIECDPQRRAGPT